MATGHFVNLTITYKSQKSNLKYQKVAESKKLRLNTFKCYKFSLFSKKKLFENANVLRIKKYNFSVYCQQNLVFRYTPINTANTEPKK